MGNTSKTWYIGMNTCVAVVAGFSYALGSVGIYVFWSALIGLGICILGWINAFIREKREKKESAYREKIDAYLDYPNDTTNPLNRLVFCKAYKLETEEELLRLCAEIKDRKGLDPFRALSTIPEGKRLKALQAIRDRQVNMDDEKQSAEFLMELNGI